MKLKIRNGVIYACEEGLEDRPIGSIFDSASEEDERIIECGSETVRAVEEFVAEVNSGSFKPRTVVRRFEEILQKYAV
jgi:hypothetical protein